MNIISYKVVTSEMKSLGLRNNPTILKYEIGIWIESPTIKEGKSDDGGIWTACKLSGARTLVKYMMNKYNVRCRVFRGMVDNVLYKNSYRLKTNKIYLVNEMTM